MAVQTLGLFDLLTPQYIAGFQFPDYIHQYLSILSVRELQTCSNDAAVVYVGRGRFGNDETDSSRIKHEEPSGASFSWDRENIFFRLTIPRDGAQFIDDALNEAAIVPHSKLAITKILLDDLKPVEESNTLPIVASEYPAMSFTLELLIDALNFSLGPDWIAGRVDTVTHRVVPDTDPMVIRERVKISLPKVKLVYQQGDNPDDLTPKFRIDSWGMDGMDAEADLQMGELVAMDPTIALHEARDVAFSVDKIIVDASENASPPDIKENFGIDDSWTGLYIKQLLFYYSNDQGVGFNLRINNALISFSGEVSLEAALDVYPRVDLTTVTFESVFYNGKDKVTEIQHGVNNPPVSTIPDDDPAGYVKVKQNAVVHLNISGGRPPFTINVFEDGQQKWDAANRQAVFTTKGKKKVFIEVEDARQSKASEYLFVDVKDGAAVPPSGSFMDNPPAKDALKDLAFNMTGGDSAHELQKREVDSLVYLSVVGGGTFTLIVTPSGGGDPVLKTGQRDSQINVPNGSDYVISLVYDAITPNNYPSREIHFIYNKPSKNEIGNYTTEDIAKVRDPQFIRDFGERGSWPDNSDLQLIHLDGYASNDPSSPSHDLTLSKNRINVVQARLQDFYPANLFDSPVPHGHGNKDESQDETFRKVVVTFTNAPVAQVSLTGTMVRPAGDPLDPPAVVPPPDAPQLPNGIPPVLTQLGIRVKIERNTLSLLELYGEIDVETEMEKHLRLGDSALSSDDVLDLTSVEDDPQNPNATHDGLIDFKLGYLWDKALQEVTITLHLFAGEDDKNGLRQMKNENGANVMKNIFGALLLFAPIIDSAATSVGQDKESAGAWAELGVALAIPIAIAGLDIFRTRRIILFGGEAISKYTVPSADNPNYSLDFGILFDYEVQFDIICESLGIGKNRLPSAPKPLPPPLRARYKAVGFKIHYQNVNGNTGLEYSPVFDSSKGYDLDLNDPSLFSLPDPLGQIFNIAGARLARFNPLTLEIDFAIKVDLGVITVDKFKLKIPISPTGPPQIIPSGIKVNLPGVLIGSGFVEILDTTMQQPDGSEVTAKGITGGLDLTLVPLKIRISADVSVMALKDQATQREAVAVFVGLLVSFPTPIVLFSTGLGIYGFSGLFAMHFMRIEDPAVPGDIAGPALKWLIKAQGQPQHLRNTSNVPLWGPAFDHWAFGVGVLIGTLDGGNLMNFQGMFVLELPGPRILIMVKIRIVTPLPDLSDTAELEVGIIGVIDLDFGKQQLTIGVLVSFNIKSFLQITIPLEIFFNLQDSSDWHFYLGTISQPASANILNIVKGSAYMMVQGNKLDYNAYAGSIPAFLQGKSLNGVAIAIGIKAALIIGDESAGIYLKIAASADLGLSFSPFMAVGVLIVSGELRLLIVSIGAHGEFDVLINKVQGANDYSTYLKGEICGSIDCFFFSISACIGMEINPHITPDLEPPLLVRGVYLQSFSPVLVTGQGSSRPIDASLGNAREFPSGGAVTDDDKLLKVPVDSVIVIQMQASPKLTGGTTVPFNGNLTLSPGVSPDLRFDPADADPAGWITLTESVKIRYSLNRITLLENNVNYTGDLPPTVWRMDKPANSTGSNTAIDLALFSRVPTASENALQRSTDLNSNVWVRWENACKNPAPPASVLFTFCSQPLGASVPGWNLNGKAKPDPEGTVRLSPVNTSMHVYQPRINDMISTLGMLMNEFGNTYDVPVKIIGIDNLRRIGQPVTDAANGVAGTSGNMAIPGPQAAIASIGLSSTINTRLGDYVHCYRTLQLPYENSVKVDPKLNDNPFAGQFKTYQDKRAHYNYVIFDIDVCDLVLFFGAVYEKFMDQILVEELDAKENVLNTYQLNTLAEKIVLNINTDLPADWLSMATGWHDQTVASALFLFSTQFAAYKKMLWKLVPQSPDCVKLAISIEKVLLHQPSMYISIMECLRHSEIVQQEIVTGILLSEQETLNGYLTNNAVVPLLKPNVEYHVVVDYTIERKSKNTDGSIDDKTYPEMQSFAFKTDSLPPSQIGSYILGSSPDMDERFHFYKDPLMVVFNSAAVIKMYEAYGNQIIAAIRGADGAPIAKNPDTSFSLSTLTGSVLSPYRDAVNQLIEQGKLPCLGGIASFPAHEIYTSPFDLKPLMDYTFDLELDPAIPLAADGVARPSYRRSFKTSRYADLQDMASDMLIQNVKHLSLTSPLVGLPMPVNPPLPQPVFTVNDKDFEDALTNAGVIHDDSKDSRGFTILWSNHNGDFNPYGILIQAIEPMWRSHFEAIADSPILNAQNQVIDPAFFTYENKQVPTMELQPGIGASKINHFIKTTAGTKSLVLFKDGAWTSVIEPVSIKVVQLASNLYQTASKSETLITLNISSKAPWED
jgi:hypothetical protein